MQAQINHDLKGAFVWDDPFLLEDQLSNDERMVRDPAAAFAADKLKPRVGLPARRNGPRHFSGNGRPRPPRYYDTRGVRRIGCGLCHLRPCGSRNRAGGFRLSFDDERTVVAGDLSHLRLWIGGAAPEVPAQTRFRRMDRLFRFDRAGRGFRSRRHENPGGEDIAGYSLRGSKTWISNSPITDVFVVWAKSAAHDNQIRGFIIEKGTPGLSAPKIGGKLSLRASITGEVVLDGVEVGEEALLPNVSVRGPFGCLNRARYGISWGVIGAAEDCWFRARQYELDRKQFGKPLAGMQFSRRSWRTCRPRFLWVSKPHCEFGRLMDENRFAPEMISIVKRNNCGKARYRENGARHAWR